MIYHDIISLRLFASVVDHRNIAQASRANNIASSAVSKRISDLEARFSVALLHRMKDGIEPTAAGLALYRQVKRVLRQLEDLDAELGEYADGSQGQVRLWANTSAVTQFLPEDLTSYALRFPDVKIELREETSPTIIDAVRDGLCDLGIFSEHSQNEGLETRVYRLDTLMVIAPVGHPIAALERVGFEETLQYDHVGLQDGSSLQSKLISHAENISATLRIRVKVLSFDGIRRMVEAGLGLAILPEGAIQPYLGTGMFSMVQLDEPWATRSLILGYKNYNSLPLVARALVECLAPDLPISR